MAIRGFLSHIDLSVSDLHASVPFYAALLERLGFERTGPADPERASWRLVDDRGAHFEIEVRRPRGTPSARRHTRNDPEIDHLAYHADSRADVDAIFEHLVDHGVAVDEPPRGYDYSPGYYAVGFDDPDGIRLEVVHDPRRTRGVESPPRPLGVGRRTRHHRIISGGARWALVI